ncbi:uncharacterized protein [Miscanthus floridulus]|uniref:uncharacterized protein n=1 Tax=Miscanthus floridulus TaxID=154761 RepID=UPI003457F69E
MATVQTSSTPSFFNFLKEGLLLPSQNRRLFAAVFTIIAVSTCLLLLGDDLAVQPLTVEIDLDTKALNSTDPSSPDFLQLSRKTQDDTRALYLTGVACLVFTVIIRSVIEIVVLFAAVATYSGELHTFGSLLGKVKTQLKGPVLTLAFVYALEIAYVAVLIFMSSLVMALMILKYFGLFFVGCLLLLAPFIFLVYFFFVCSLSVVVAVAEPGCHGAGALGRAWRLVKGKRRRAMLLISVTGVLSGFAAALTPVTVYNLAKTCALSNTASGLLLGFLYIILIAAVKLFAACAMTAFYYECKGSTVGYVKVSTKEQIDLQPSAMATVQTSSTPSFFNFLKEGLLLPSHNRRLFAAVFTIIAVSTCLLLLGGDLAVQPLREELDLDTKALNSTDPSTSSPEDILQLIQKTKDDIRALLLTSAALVVPSVVIGSAIRLVLLFAAVATYSGELHTFGSLLGKVKTQLKGPVLTLAFVYALEIVYFVLLVAMIGLVMFLMIKKYMGLFFVGSLLLLVPFVFLVYFSFLCSMSVVVAVAEPGCHGAGALGRAWRLLKGKRRRVMLFISVTGVLATALTPVYTLAKRCELTNMAAGLLLGFLYSILMSAVQLFAACAMAAFYYECKGSTEASAAEYIKVSTKEQVDA